jgi:hypothetical protein
LDSFRPAHAQGQADDDLYHSIVLDYALKLGQVGALVLALQGFDALGGDSEGVGDGHAYAADANVEAEDSAKRSFPLPAFGFRREFGFGLRASGFRCRIVGRRRVHTGLDVAGHVRDYRPDRSEIYPMADKAF